MSKIRSALNGIALAGFESRSPNASALLLLSLFGKSRTIKTMIPTWDLEIAERWEIIIMMFRFEHIQYFCREVERQQAGVEYVAGMAKGFARAFDEGIKSLEDINNIAGDVTLNRCRYGYRNTPVRFASGGHACNWQSIPNAMHRWWENRPQNLEVFADYPIDIQVVDAWVKAFLDIHPYEDGNGRTASILRNWVLGKFDDPADLPYYNF